jgi:hypothetical protein
MSTKDKKIRKPGRPIRRLQAPAATDDIEHMVTMLSSNHPRMVAMAREMAAYLASLNPPASDKGTLEIEATFCDGDIVRLGPRLDALKAQLVLTACDRGLAEWTSKDDEWSLYYDTIVQLPASKKSMRVRSINGGEHRNIAKTLLARLDTQSSADKDLTMRVQAKVEREVQCTHQNRVLLLPPESVRVSTRRSFESISSTLRNVKYRYTIIKGWTGRCAKEAEQIMHEGKDTETQGVSSVEVEVELPWPVQEHATLVYACLGLMMKAQDIVELLTGDRSVHKLKFLCYDDFGKALQLRKRKAVATPKPHHGSRKRGFAEISAFV